jgi:hypothetical protein
MKGNEAYGLFTKSSALRQATKYRQEGFPACPEDFSRREILWMILIEILSTFL